LLVNGGVLFARQPEDLARRLVDHYAAVYSVPPELVDSIIELESAWQPYAVSPKGAAGLMQLMPATAIRLGLTNRFDIEQNIRGGVVYLAQLLVLFKGDLRLVAAAYVMGEGRIVSAGLEYSNAEVFVYVRKVVRLYQEKRLKRFRMEGFSQTAAKGGSWP
jgi:soluble lytic murein transglycosylase-like protein